MNNYNEYYNKINDSAQLNVLYTGYQKCGPGHESRGVRNHFLLHYVVNGEGHIVLNKKKYILNKGDLFIIYPGQRHFYKSDIKNPWEYSWIGFSGTHCEVFLSKAGIRFEHPVFKADFSNEIFNLIKQLLENLLTKKKGFELKSEGIFFLIIAALIEIANTKPNKKIKKKPKKVIYQNYTKNTQSARSNKKFIKHLSLSSRKTAHILNALGFIDVYYQRRIRASQISEYLGLDRTYFSALFKKGTGESVRDYLIGYRIDKAKNFLANSNLSINEISSSVGYHDYFNFEKIFKKKEGITPTEYRKTN